MNMMHIIWGDPSASEIELFRWMGSEVTSLSRTCSSRPMAQHHDMCQHQQCGTCDIELVLCCTAPCSSMCGREVNVSTHVVLITHVIAVATWRECHVHVFAASAAACQAGSPVGARAPLWAQLALAPVYRHARVSSMCVGTASRRCGHRYMQHGCALYAIYMSARCLSSCLLHAFPSCVVFTVRRVMLFMCLIPCRSRVHASVHLCCRHVWETDLQHRPQVLELKWQRN